MPKLIALKPFTYMRRPLRPGQEFAASDRDARLFMALRRAKPAPDPVPDPVSDVAPASRRRARKPAPECVEQIATEDIPPETPQPAAHQYATRHLIAGLQERVEDIFQVEIKTAE